MVENNFLIKKLKPYLENIENESSILYMMITEYLFKLSGKIINKEFKRFPKFEDKIMEIFVNILEKEKKKQIILSKKFLKLNYIMNSQMIKNF